MKQSPLGLISLSIGLTLGLVGFVGAVMIDHQTHTLPAGDIRRLGLVTSKILLLVPAAVTSTGVVVGLLGVRVDGHRSTAAIWGLLINSIASVLMWLAIMKV